MDTFLRIHFHRKVGIWLYPSIVVFVYLYTFCNNQSLFALSQLQCTCFWYIFCKKHFGSFLALQRSIISTGLEHVVDTILYLWKGQVDMKSNIIWEWSREEEKKDIFDSYRSNLIDKSFAWFLCNLEENMILTVRSLFILYCVHFLLKVF